MKETVIEYMRELQERQLVDAQLDAEEEALKVTQEAKRKEDAENMKFDVDAAERDDKVDEKSEEKEEKKDSEKKE
jgi:hypothetical protein